MDDLTIQLLPKQAQLLHATERHRLYSGAVGAGKTRGLCIDAFAHVVNNPQARYGLFRKTNVALVRSTLKTLLEGDGDKPPVLPRGSYDHNRSRQEIRLVGGGEILYLGLEDRERARSLNLSRGGIDEVTECAFEDYLTVNDRIRMGTDQALVSVTNPGGPGHWCAEFFGIKGGSANPPENRMAVMTRTSDNHFLPPEYLAELQTYTGAYYRRMVLGEWCQAEGVVYDVFDRERHVVSMPERDCPVYGGVDFGYVDPFVALRVERHDGGHLHVRREVHKTRLQPDAQVSAADESLQGAGEVVCDSAEPGTIQMMRAKGIPAIPADKGPGSIVAGIRLVSQRLANGTLTIEPDCTHTIAEFETYQWKENKLGLRDSPAEGSDHSMDALRYVVQRLDAGQTPMVAAVGTIDDEDVDDSQSWDEWRAENPDAGWV